jgi:hypothetical protein
MHIFLLLYILSVVLLFPCMIVQVRVDESNRPTAGRHRQLASKMLIWDASN